MSNHSYIPLPAPLDCILLCFISQPNLYSPPPPPPHKSICFAEPCESVQYFIHTRARLCKVPHEWFLEHGYKMIKVVPRELLLMSYEIWMVTFYLERNSLQYRGLYADPHRQMVQMCSVCVCVSVCWGAGGPLSQHHF